MFAFDLYDKVFGGLLIENEAEHEDRPERLFWRDKRSAPILRELIVGFNKNGFRPGTRHKILNFRRETHILFRA